MFVEIVYFSEREGGTGRRKRNWEKA